MSASPHNIWQVPAYLPYVQPPLTDQVLRDAERLIGHRLPEAYIALIKQQNGGYIRHRLPDCVHSQIYGIGPHFPSLTGFDWEGSRESVSYELTGLVPFDGDGHWHLCFDFRGGRSMPGVTYVDLECDSELEIASSFADYLALLRVDVGEGDFVMLGISDIEQAVRDLAGRIGVQFEPPDSFEHGYPVRRARGGRRVNPEWIWISPNLVPRGFVRDDDPRFEELRASMSGHAPRYPEVPESGYILSTTDGIRAAVLRACTDCIIDVKPLISYVT
jgi:hypothetical protein